MSTEDISENTHVMIAIIYFIKANFMAIILHIFHFAQWGNWARRKGFKLQNPTPKPALWCKQRKLKAHFKTNKQKSSSHNSAKSVWTPSASNGYSRTGLLHTLPRSTMVWLNERMGDRIISQRANVSWPPHSPDLSPLDFYLWGFLKRVWYTQRILKLWTSWGTRPGHASGKSRLKHVHA